MPTIPPSIVVVLAIALPAVAAAQASQPPHWTPEFSAAAGVGHVFRWEDQTYGNPPSIGGAVALVRGSRLALELSFDKPIGLEPLPVPCGLVNVTCVGTANYGPRSVAVAAVTAQYRFGGTRVRPYLLGGLGVLWSTSSHSLTQVQGPIAIVSESTSSDRGFGPDLGAGLHVRLTRAVTISPEVRWLDAPWLSRENLAVTRFGVRVSYSPRRR